MHLCIASCRTTKSLVLHKPKLQPKDEIMKNSKRKLVYLGFGSQQFPDALVHEVCLLVRTLRRHHCKVIIPAQLSLSEKLRGVTKVRNRAPLPPGIAFCLFVTPSLPKRDNELAEQLSVAQKGGLDRQGFIMKLKGEETRLVTPLTFQLFSEYKTDAANAIHTHSDILGCIRGQLMP